MPVEQPPAPAAENLNETPNGGEPTPAAPAAPPHAIGEHFVHQVKQSDRWLAKENRRWKGTALPHPETHQHTSRMRPVPVDVYSEYGQVTKPHPGIWVQSNGHAPGGAVLDAANKLVGYDHWTEHAPALTPLEVRDLYRSYKHTPHAPASMFLKYLVHRFNHVAEYDDPTTGHKLDVEFRNLVQKGRAGEKNGHVSISQLHEWTRRWAPSIMPKLLETRAATQESVARGIGLTTRSINGETYVALTRGLDDEMMSNEHPLSSHADKPETGFGKNMHHSWVPLKDLWFSYDLGDRYASGNMGPEDEWLVSNSGTRYQATPEDVKHNRVGDAFDNFLDEEPGIRNPPHDDATDEQLADYVRTIRSGGYQVTPSLPMWLLNHKNAGPATFAAVSEDPDTGTPYIPRRLHAYKWVPRSYVLDRIASEGLQSPEYSLKNPNLTAEDLTSLSKPVLNPPSWTRDAKVAVESWMDSPKMNSHILERAFRDAPVGPASAHLLSSPLATPTMLQGAADRLSQGWYDQMPEQAGTVVTNIAKNPHHTQEQALAAYNWLVKNGLFTGGGAGAWAAGTLKLPEPVLRDLIARAKPVNEDLSDWPNTDKDHERVVATNILSDFTVNNPHAGPALAKLAAEGLVRINRLELRLGHFDRLEPELQPAYIAMAEKSPAPQSWLTTLAGSKGLTQESINALAHYPYRNVRENLFLNKSVTPEQIREAFPKEVEFPESPNIHFDGGRFGHVAEEISQAYHRRKKWDARMLREHFVKPLPQNLAKSEDDLWQAQARDWLAQQKTHGFYYPTTHDRALNIIRDGAIEPDLTDELLHGEAVFAHRESPTFLDHWHKTAGPDDVVLYFETPAEPETHEDGRFFWTDRVPVENARIADTSAGEEPLNKFHAPLLFPRLGVSDDRRETKLVSTVGQRKTFLRASAVQAVRENVTSQETAQRVQDNPSFREGLTDDVYKRYAKGPGHGVTFEGLAGVGHPGHASDAFTRSVTPGSGTGQSALSASYAPGAFPKSKKWGPNDTQFNQDPNSFVATAHHEDLHRIFARVQHLHGEDARRTLTSNLMYALPKDLRAKVDAHLRWRRPDMESAMRRGGKMMGEPNEEAITELHSYLSVPSQRDQFHRLRQDSPEQQRAFHDHMKRAYRLLQAVSATADEGWLQRLRPWLKKGEASTAFHEVQGTGLSAQQAHEVFRGSLKLSKAQPDLLDPNRFAFEYENNPALQAAVEERHQELVLRKMASDGDVLEKMSVFHDDPKNPRAIYRVENARGQGPYQNKYDVMPDKERDTKWAARRPTPGRDFPPSEWTQNPEGGLFGFARPEDAVEWFGPHRLARLKNEGYELREVLAQKAYLSNSGRQVVFQRPPPTQLGQAPANPVVPVPKVKEAWTPHPEATQHVVNNLRHAHDTHLDKLSAAYAKLPKPKKAKVEGLEDSFQQALSEKNGEALKDHPFVQWARTVVPEFGQAPVQKSEEHVNITLPHEKVLGPGEESAAKAMLGHNKVHETALAAARFLVGRKEPVDEDMFRVAMSVFDGDVERAALIAVSLTDSEANLKALRAVLKLGEFSPDHVHELTKNEPGTPHLEKVVAGAPDAVETAAEVARAATAGLVQPLVLGGKHSKGAMAVRDPQTGSVLLLKPGSGKQSPAAGARDDASSQSAREAAFWHCADKLGMGRYYPRADLLQVNGAEVAAMKLLGSQWKSLDERNRQVDGYAREVLAPYLKRGDVHRLAFLAWVLGDPDSHGQNWMVHAEAVAGIDHGSAFAGPNFNPGKDSKSFTPYVLRVFGQSGYSKAKPEERVKTLPVLNRETDSGFRKWVLAIDPATLVEVMSSHSIGEVAQKAVVQRLDDLQRYQGPNLSAYLNALWAGAAD